MRTGLTARASALVSASLVLVLVAASGRAAGATDLHVIPFPGTPDVSPSSPVIFSALRPSELLSLHVSGSLSGVHAGRLELLPAGSGTAFVPSRRFRPGDTVRVAATLSSSRAGVAEGERGATRLTFSFEVEVQRTPVATDPNQAVMARSGPGPTQHFHSAPGLRPPAITATADPDSSSGDIFAGIVDGPQFGPMILNPRGQLVWFLPHRSTANFAVQHYLGRPVLTWWQGVEPPPAEDVIMNQSYRTVAVVHGADGLTPDPHEFEITPQNTALFSTASITDANLSGVGGPVHGTVIDDVIQEVDIKSGQLLWEWHSLGHVPLSASYAPVTHKSWPPYDYFHLNSIQQLPGGNLLISARDTWAVYEVSRQTGRVIWTLGGKDSNFKMGSGTNFEWQHDARLHGQTLSLFDDADSPQEERESSAKLLRLNPRNRSVSLIRRFTHSPPLLVPEMGSVQTLANGNVFVGWGNQPQFSEYTSGGRQIFNAAAPLGVVFYRVFRFPWIGHPETRPSLAVSRRAHGHTTVYASWNGATQVAKWRVLGGSAAHHLKPVGATAAPTGFETAISVSSGAHYFAVQALNRRGKVLGTSAAGAPGR